MKHPHVAIVVLLLSKECRLGFWVIMSSSPEPQLQSCNSVCVTQFFTKKCKVESTVEMCPSRGCPLVLNPFLPYPKDPNAVEE